jgi:hypothetical protein
MRSREILHSSRSLSHQGGTLALRVCERESRVKSALILPTLVMRMKSRSRLDELAARPTPWLAFEWPADVTVAEVRLDQRLAPLRVAAACTEGHLNVLLQFSPRRTFHTAQFAPEAGIRKQR